MTEKIEIKNGKVKVVEAIHGFTLIGGIVLLVVDAVLVPSDVAWVAAVGLGLILVALCLGIRNM